MAPNLFGNSATLFYEASQKEISKPKSVAITGTYTEKLKNSQYRWKIVWRNVIAFVYLHIGALYGFYLFFTGAKFLTLIWSKYN